MKRRITAMLCAALCLATLALTSCGIISDLNNAIEYPESYSITYEVTSDDGVISTITKTVDENGSVYMKNGDSEVLYINDNGSYTLYEKNEDGSFEKVGDEKYTRKSIEEATSDINKYAEESMNKFMPTASSDGTEEVAGRECEVYKLGVGNDSNGAYYYYYVDTETGICLGTAVHQSALGEELEYEGESFICTEFMTENVKDLSEMITE